MSWNQSRSLEFFSLNTEALTMLKEEILRTENFDYRDVKQCMIPILARLGLIESASMGIPDYPFYHFLVGLQVDGFQGMYFSHMPETLACGPAGKSEALRRLREIHINRMGSWAPKGIE